VFALLILSTLGLAEFASLRWGVDTRDGYDWHVEDRQG
jgi:hypothetical protein